MTVFSLSVGIKEPHAQVALCFFHTHRRDVRVVTWRTLLRAQLSLGTRRLGLPGT